LPLYKLLKKADRFAWTPKAQEALDKLKKLLTSPPILVALRSNEPLLLYIAHVVSAALIAECQE
jgi:hypothetical protein